MLWHPLGSSPGVHPSGCLEWDTLSRGHQTPTRCGSWPVSRSDRNKGFREPSEAPQGFRLRQSSGAFDWRTRIPNSARGLAHSKTLARQRKRQSVHGSDARSGNRGGYSRAAAGAWHTAARSTTPPAPDFRLAKRPGFRKPPAEMQAQDHPLLRDEPHGFAAYSQRLLGMNRTGLRFLRSITVGR